MTTTWTGSWPDCLELRGLVGGSIHVVVPTDPATRFATAFCGRELSSSHRPTVWGGGGWFCRGCLAKLPVAWDRAADGALTIRLQDGLQRVVEASAPEWAGWVDFLAALMPDQGRAP